MKRRTTSAGAVRAAVRSAVALETLELRRLLSYDLAATIIDTDDGGGYKNFGRSNIATQGNLALIGSPGQTASITFDGGDTYTDIDETDGQVALVDMTDGTVLQTFHNPISNPPTGQLFGTAVAFVDGKIAITAPGAVTTYIYDDASDEIPDSQYTYGIDPFVIYGSTISVQGDDLLVGVLQATVGTSNGSIVRYDLDSPSTTHVAEYLNPDPGVSPSNNQFGSALASDGEYIYAKAIIDGDSAVVIMDDIGDHVFTYHALPGDTQFGMALAATEHPTDGNSVIISDPIANRVIQVDLAGNTLQTFDLPTDDQIFGAAAFSLVVNDGKLFAGNPTKLTLGGDTFLHTTGAVYVFDLASGSLDQTIENPNQDDTLNSDLADEYDYFGLSLGTLPDCKIIVAAPFANNANGINAGTVFVYEPEVVAPTNSSPENLAIAGQADAVRQQSVTFTGSFTDPDAGDTHTVAWDFGDGNVIAAHSTTDAGALAPSHVYTAAGVFTVTMTITDDSGELNASASTTHQVTVTATGVQGGTLYVGGSNGADVITVNNAGITIGGVTTPYTGGSIVVYAGSGNDILIIPNSVTANVEAHGGAGNDILSGGGGESILVGDAGNDLITGGNGRDLLIGGVGNDFIFGNADQDILISGYTVHDNDSAQLAAIQAVWTGPGTYTTRVNDLRSAAGLLTADVDVFDDGNFDLLSGGAGSDWFIFNVDAINRDFVTDRTAAEFQTDIDQAMA